jgi:hypothetical protein
MKYFGYILVGIVSSALTFWAVSGGYVVGPSLTLSPPRVELTYADFLSALLTILGLILAALAIVIGLVAFQTIGDIKREARRIAEEHSKSEVERSLETVPERVGKSVQEQVSKHLPSAIDEAVEKAGKEGRLDEALQKAMMQFTAGGGEMNAELQPDFEKSSDAEGKNV